MYMEAPSTLDLNLILQHVSNVLFMHLVQARRDCERFAGIAKRMAALSLCPLLEAVQAKLKKEDETEEKKGVKREAPTVGATPSPNKKLASDMEKKMKSLPGDCAFMKARHLFLSSFMEISWYYIKHSY